MSTRRGAIIKANVYKVPISTVTNSKLLWFVKIVMLDYVINYLLCTLTWKGSTVKTNIYIAVTNSKYDKLFIMYNHMKRGYSQSKYIQSANE